MLDGKDVKMKKNCKLSQPDLPALSVKNNSMQLLFLKE